MTTIITKNSSTASAAPVAGDLTKGELAVNVTDKKLYTKDNGGSVVKLVGSLGNQEANAVAITGGAIDGTPIGGTTASTASFTTVSASGNVTLSGGTANGVLYLNGSKVATSGSSLTFDGTNLGVNSPILAARTLSVKGRAAFTATANDSQLAIYSDGSTNGLYSTYNSTGSYLPMTFWINDAEQMRLTSTGLGIGTSSPSQKLEVNGNALFSGGQIVLNSSSANYLYFKNGTSLYVSDTVGNVRATLDSSGNLGLGLTPNTWYSTFKAFQFGGNGSSLFGRSENNMAAIGSNVYVNAAGSNTYINSNTASYFQQLNGAFQWYTAPSGTAGNAITFTQAMTLDASGNLLVGATSGNARISGYNAGLVGYFERTDAGGVAEFKNGSDAGYGIGFKNVAGSVVGSIYWTGSATTYATSSDYRLKNVIGNVTGSGARIDALEPIEYEWKSNGERTRGFLAHKFQEVYPQSVTGTKDAVDADGNPVYQAMQASTSEVIADLVAEIKSLRARVAQLESN